MSDTAAFSEAVEQLEARLLAAWVRGPELRKAWTPDQKEFRAEKHRALARTFRALADIGVEGDLWGPMLDRLMMTGELAMHWPLGRSPLDTTVYSVASEDLARWRELRCLFALRQKLTETLSGLTPTSPLSETKNRLLSAIADASLSDPEKSWSLPAGMLAAYEAGRVQCGVGIMTGITNLDIASGGLRPGDCWVMAAPTNWGKCLGPSTRVLTSNGSVVAAQDVRPGDELMGPDSQPRLVKSIVRGEAPMFDIVPKRGESWGCNSDHILVVQDSALGGEQTEISVQDFLSRPKTWQATQKLFHVAVNYPKRRKPRVDPWLMGNWYADGNKDLKTFSICTPDPEVISGLEAQAKAWGLMFSRTIQGTSKASLYHLRRPPGSSKRNPLLTAMRREVGGQVSLPASLTHGSRETRLQFLAGWVDGDGYAKGARYCEILTQHEAWARQLRVMVRSLGLQCHIYRKTNVKGYEDRVYWRLHLSGDLSVIPTRVARKHFPKTTSHKDPNRVGFKIVPTGTGPYCGWVLDGDGLFLLGDLTVTHNTSWMLGVVDRALIVHGRGALIVTCEDDPIMLFQRWLARRADVKGTQIRDGRLSTSDNDRVVAEVQRANEAGPRPVMIDGRGRPVEYLAEAITRHMIEHPCSLVVVDYIQCIGVGRKNDDRRHEINFVRSTLHNAVRSRGGALLLGSQLSDGDHVRDSRDVENDATVVLIGKETEEGTKSLWVKKVKSGPRGFTVDLNFDAMKGFFRDERQDDYAIAYDN